MESPGGVTDKKRYRRPTPWLFEIARSPARPRYRRSAGSAMPACRPAAGGRSPLPPPGGCRRRPPGTPRFVTAAPSPPRPPSPPALPTLPQPAERFALSFLLLLPAVHVAILSAGGAGRGPAAGGGGGEFRVVRRLSRGGSCPAGPACLGARVRGWENLACFLPRGACVGPALSARRARAACAPKAREAGPVEGPRGVGGRPEGSREGEEPGFGRGAGRIPP